MEQNSFVLAVLVVSLVAGAVALRRAYAAVDDSLVGEWAQAHALDITPENRPMVGWYLRTARVLRTWGALGGLFLPTLVALARGELRVLGIGANGSLAFGEFGWCFVGYLLGALYAEVSLVRPVEQGRRSASLVPRRLEDYLPRRLLILQRGLGVVAVLGVLTLAKAPFAEGVTTPSWPGIVLFAAVLIAITVGLERVERWLVGRPQPFTTPSLVAADDAIRAQSVHSVAGSGLALLLLLNSGLSLALATSEVTVLRWTMWVPAVAALLLSLVACQWWGHLAWRVRRVAGPTEAPSA